MMTDTAILQWLVRAQLSAVVFFIVQSPSSVTPLEDWYGACSRRFMIFCAGANGKGWSWGVSQVVLSPFLKWILCDLYLYLVKHSRTWNCASSNTPSVSCATHLLACSLLSPGRPQPVLPQCLRSQHTLTPSVSHSCFPGYIHLQQQRSKQAISHWKIVSVLEASAVCQSPMFL